MLAAAPDTRCFRDPTRGGLSSTLNEFAAASGVQITVVETAVPVKPQVRGASEMLGYDVFQVANEGKMVAIVPAEQAEAALAAMKASPYGEDAAIIGEVEEGKGTRVREDELRRDADHGHARRRAAAEDLLDAHRRPTRDLPTAADFGGRRALSAAQVSLAVEPSSTAAAGSSVGQRPDAPHLARREVHVLR